MGMFAHTVPALCIFSQSLPLLSPLSSNRACECVSKPRAHCSASVLLWSTPQQFLWQTLRGCGPEGMGGPGGRRWC